MITQHYEVLSPVGNEEMLIAATRCGADAVYLGAEHFNARRNAENFSDEKLKRAIQYCHIRGVKVFLTLNIVVSDKEIRDALLTAETAYKYGIDAIICADLGLIELLHRRMPSLPLHASTQMTVTNAAALPFLKSLGISRVVLPREMSKEQIGDFCAAATENGIETEVFVHGALCMSVSGQCLLSSMLGGRSGNRGLCAGPCRLPFSSDKSGSYDLSLKDLSLIEYITELKNLGVTSFKIEGRMKRPEYVAAATAAVRSAVDKGDVTEELLLTLRNVFARSGFTDGYFTNSLSPDMFGTRTIDDVQSATDAFPKLHEIFRHERQSVPLTATLSVKTGEKICLSLCDGTNTAVSFSDIPETAINRPVTKDMLLQNLQKFGGTPYLLKGFEIILDDGLAVSAKVINNLRRDCVEKLNILRAAPDKTEIIDFPIGENFASVSKTPEIFCRFGNTEQIPTCLHGIKYISLPLECNIDRTDIPDTVIKVVDIPRTFDIATKKKLLEKFREKGFTHALCSTIADFCLAEDSGFSVIGGMGLNVFNSYSAKALFDRNAAAVVLSPEIQLTDAAKINGNIGITAYGNIPLMLAANCPIKNKMSCKNCGRAQGLTDRLGVFFPVRCRMGMSEILNSRPIWLADRMKEINCDFAVLYFTDETASRVAEIINAHKNGLPPDTEYTRGLYYRGIQ